VRFLLSTSDTLDGTEVILGTRSLASLAAGASSSAVSTFVIPGNTPVPATYRVIAVADALSQQSELDETNNTLASRALPITAYQPDLAITALSVPATGQAGRPLAITHTVRNAGPAAAAAFVVRFYLSADGVLDDGDVLLGTRSIGGLGAGASSAAVSTFTVPTTTSVPASYRIIAVADALAQRAELDESNNLAVSTPLSLTAYRPDLALTALTLPATAQAGRPLAITHTVRNVGSAPAGAFAIRFYLSSDDTFDASDVLLGSRSLAALGPGVSSTAVSTFTVPANTSVPATYRVIARVDALSQQTELDETNNLAVSTAALPVTAYLPDLVLTTVSAPASVQAGHSLAIAHTVRNAGPAPAGAFAIRFYLSSDGALDGGDLLLGSRTVPSLGAGISSAAVSAFIVPSTVPAGPYRVVAVVDALAQQPELDEAANVAVSGVVTVSP
jgi:subtilase family serine protease